MKHSSIALTLLAALVLPLGTAHARTWTNTTGKTIDAEIVEATETEVVLKLKATGKNYRLTHDKLSADDQAFIKSWLEEQKKKANEPVVEENWDDPWPGLVSTDIDPEIEVIKDEAPEFIYASPHYEFHCDVGLSKSVVKRFAVLFEATNEYCRALPISMQKARQDKRHKIQLFETRDAYVSAGAPPDSAGVYMGGKDVIMIPLTSLGVEKVASSYMVDHKKSNKTLPHEIFHQLTDRQYYLPGARGWLTEGLAEYVAVTPYRSGKFRVSTVLNPMKDYVTGYGPDGRGGRAIGEDVQMPPIKDWFLQDYSSFTANPQINYGMAALITYYFAHMDGEKDATRLKGFLKVLKDGKKGEEALEVLLDGRSYETLQKEITSAWRGRGVKIDWRSS